MLSPRQIEARDRRLAAVHEAGHFVIGRHYGLRYLRPSIWHQPNEQPKLEKTWLGRIVFLGPELRRLSLKSRTKFAVAGAVAEHIWLEEDFDFIDWEEPEIMSDLDWSLAEVPPGEPTPKLYRAVDEVAALLLRGSGQLWSPLCAMARKLWWRQPSIRWRL